MKLISQFIIISLLVFSAACSKEEAKTQTESAKTATAIDTVTKTETISINNAKQVLDDSKKVDQVIMDSAEQQRETIEKTQQ